MAALAAAAVPTAAHAAGMTVTGVVVAKEAGRGTLVVAGRSGLARTVHARLSAARLGDRVSVGGTLLRDGTIRSSKLRVVGHARVATVRGVIVRRLATRTLVSTGRSVIAIQRRAAKRSLSARGLAPGTVARFGVSFAGGKVRETSASALSTTGTVEVEGKVVTLSPFVVNVEGLPVTIGLGAVTLPPALAVGDEVELTVSVDANNAFTLVSVDEFQSEPAVEPGDNQGGDDQGDDNGQAGQGQEVEVEGTVVSSTATQVVVADNAGNQTTFVAGPGMTLPILTAGTRVEAKGISANGVVTLVKLDVKGQEQGDDGSGSGSSGGDDGGGSGSGGDSGGSGSGSGGGGDDGGGRGGGDD